MNEEFKIEFRRSFKIVDNDNLTQNLHSLVYKNNRLVSECDLGKIEDILIQNKKNKEAINKVIDYINNINMYRRDDELDYAIKILKETKQGG